MRVPSLSFCTRIFPSSAVRSTRILEDMITRGILALTIAILSVAPAQDPPTPTPSPTAAEFPSPLISPDQIIPSATPEQTSSPSPVRSVRISFLPPPMEGTISLGIYNQTGKIVRVLHQNAQFDDFTIGADALATRWDGKDDEHQDLPAGRCCASGCAVG